MRRRRVGAYDADTLAYALLAGVAFVCAAGAVLFAMDGRVVPTFVCFGLSWLCVLPAVVRWRGV